MVGTGRSGGQEPRNILAYLLGISRYLLGTPTSNLRSDLRGGGGGGGGVGGSEKVKRRVSIKQFPPLLEYP